MLLLFYELLSHILVFSQAVLVLSSFVLFRIILYYHWLIFGVFFLSFQFSKIREHSSFLSLPCVQIEILTQTRQEMSLVPGDSLARLVMDWIRRLYVAGGDAGPIFDSFVDKVIFERIFCSVRFVSSLSFSLYDSIMFRLPSFSRQG